MSKGILCEPSLFPLQKNGSGHHIERHWVKEKGRAGLEKLDRDISDKAALN